MKRIAGFALAAMIGMLTMALAAPSAFADISVGYTAIDSGTSAQISGTGTNSLAVGSAGPPVTYVAVGNFGVTISTTTNDPLVGGTTSFPGYSNISTTTISVKNTGTTPGTDTLYMYVTGTGFAYGSIAHFAVSGTAGGWAAGNSTTGYSWISSSNTAYGGSVLAASGTGTAIPPSGGLLGTTTGSGDAYTFANNGNSQKLSFTRAGYYGMTQLLAIKLASGTGGQFTITTTAVAPEPSSMALAGVGALGLIGYGVRRRKTRTP